MWGSRAAQSFVACSRTLPVPAHCARSDQGSKWTTGGKPNDPSVRRMVTMMFRTYLSPESLEPADSSALRPSLHILPGNDASAVQHRIAMASPTLTRMVSVNLPLRPSRRCSRGTYLHTNTSEVDTIQIRQPHPSAHGSRQRKLVPRYTYRRRHLGQKQHWRAGRRPIEPGFI